MLNRAQKILSFNKLASALEGDTNFDNAILIKVNDFNAAIEKAASSNVWFSKENILLALHNILDMLRSSQLKNWLSAYPEKMVSSPKTVGVVMAGNIPMVGFHDFLCVLMSGNRFLGKLSHDDSFLLPALADILMAIEPEFTDMISFTDGFLKNFDAVIATGSDNTARHFDFYFGKYPHLIRHNRNGVGVLSGDESILDFEGLAHDILDFYGMGCRSVSMLLVPEKYDFVPFLDVMSKYSSALRDHSRYFHNYEYNRAINLLNETPHFDNGSIILKEAADFRTPVAVLNYQYYHSFDDVNQLLDCNKEKIQCVLSKNAFIKGSFPFGKAQSPSLSDYADGVDTMLFLNDL